MKKLLIICIIGIVFGINVFGQVMQPNLSAEEMFRQKILEIESERLQEKTKSTLSTLWAAITLDMIVADLLGLYIPEGIEEWTKFAKGKESEIMMGGAIMYQLPISMVFLSKVLPYKANRMANIIAAGLMSVAVVAGGDSEPEYLVCAGVELIGFSLIAWKAWKWQDPALSKSKHDFGLNMNYQKKALGLSYSYNF